MSDADPRVNQELLDRLAGIKRELKALNTGSLFRKQLGTIGIAVGLGILFAQLAASVLGLRFA